MIRGTGLSLGLALVASPCLGQQVASDDSTFADGILVTTADVLTCPYRFVGAINVNVTEDYNADTHEKIHRKFRDRARKMGADAVVLIVRGDTHMTAWAWNRREYTGRAIRYVDRSCAPDYT